MPTDPITGTIREIDLHSRFLHSTTVVASPADATETIIASLTVTDNISAVQGVEVVCFAAFTIGTSGVSGNLKVRHTDASGATLGATGVVNVGVWAATQLTELYVAGFDTAPVLPGQVYVATLTVGSAAAASTVSAVYLRALVI